MIGNLAGLRFVIDGAGLPALLHEVADSSPGASAVGYGAHGMLNR